MPLNGSKTSRVELYRIFTDRQGNFTMIFDFGYEIPIQSKILAQIANVYALLYEKDCTQILR